MDILELRRHILLNLYEVNDIINGISVDKLSRQIANENDFWYQLFSNIKLPVINKRHTIKRWLMEYAYSTLCEERTNQIINVLKGDDSIHNSRSLEILITSPNHLHILAVDGINIDEVIDEMLSAFIHEKHHHKYYDNVDDNVYLSYDKLKNNFEINIFADKVIEEYRIDSHISEKSTHDIIYHVQYYHLKHSLTGVDHDCGFGTYKNYAIIL